MNSEAAATFVRLLGPLDPDETREILKLAVTRTYEPGQAILWEGTASRNLHLLVRGRVRLSKSRPDGSQEILGFITPLALFGHVAWFARLSSLSDTESPALAQATAAAMESSTCYGIPMTLFSDQGEGATGRLAVKVREAALRCMNQQLRAMISRIASLTDADELVDRLADDLGSWSLPEHQDKP